jgi:hypothetical protein
VRSGSVAFALVVLAIPEAIQVVIPARAKLVGALLNDGADRLAYALFQFGPVDRRRVIVFFGLAVSGGGVVTTAKL